MHSILQNPTKRVPMHTVDTDSIIKIIETKDLNPNYEMIQKLRKLDKSDSEYRAIKKSLRCFTPNASFSNYVDGNNVSTSSGYVYMDFDATDGFDHEMEMRCLKKNPHVYAAWTSAGGLGIGCLLKSDWTDNTDTTFKHAFYCALEALTQYGSTSTYIDKDCSDITRLNFISSSEVYINKNAISLKKCELEIKGDTSSFIYPIGIKELASPYNEQQVASSLFFRTQINDWNQDEPFRFYPEGKNFVDIYIGHNKIPSGQRTKQLFLICCKLAVINPGANEEQLFGHMWTINKGFCTIPKSPREINKIVNSVIKIYKEGRLHAPSTLKYVWFNPAYSFSPKTKQSIASTQIRSNQKNVTFHLLESCIQDLKRENANITQSRVAERSGKNIRTVKRYWDQLREFIF
jgi:hypothetical protein